MRHDARFSLMRLRPILLHPVRLLAALLLAAFPLAALAAGNGSLAVSALVPNKMTCKFSSATLLLDFGNLNPASAANATASTTATFTCNGGGAGATGAFAFSTNNGLYAAGGPRMRHATLAGEFVPYSFSLSPASGVIAKGATLTLTVTGTILASDFQNAAAGAYRDTVLITLAP